MQVQKMNNYTSKYLSISDTTKIEANQLIEKTFQQAIELIKKKFSDIKYKDHYGLYSSGSIAISDIIVREDGGISSDIDIILYFPNDFNLDDTYLIAKEITKELEKLPLKIDFTISTPKQAIELAKTNVSIARLNHIAGFQFDFKFNVSLKDEKVLRHVLYIEVPYGEVGLWKCYYSNTKFLIRSLEYLIGTNIISNPSLAKIIELSPLLKNEKDLIISFLRKRSLINPKKSLCEELIDFNLRFLKKYILADFSHKEEFQISNDIKLNYIYNSYLNSLINKNFDLMGSMKDLGFKFIVGEDAVKQQHRYHQFLWNIVENQRTQRIFRLRLDEDLVYLGLRKIENYQFLTAKDITERINDISFVKIEFKSKTPNISILLILKELSQKRIPIEINNPPELILSKIIGYPFLRSSPK